MKKILVAMMVLMLSVFAAHSEETPDGTTQTVYYPYFEKDALSGFQYVVYPEKSGLLLSAYSDDCEIAVTIEQDETAQDERAFLQNYINGISRYAALTNSPEIQPWNTPQAKTGAKTGITYRSKKAANDEEGYVTDAFCLKTEEGMYLLIVFNSWDQEAKNEILSMENRFFASFHLEKRAVSDQYLAFLKYAREDEAGELYAVLDFCSVVYDESIFTVYAQNQTEAQAEYRISDDALIWTEDASAALYSAVLIEPTAENLNETAAHYYDNRGFDIIFQVKFNEKGEIVWMMHYNAF